MGIAGAGVVGMVLLRQSGKYPCSHSMLVVVVVVVHAASSLPEKLQLHRIVVKRIFPIYGGPGQCTPICRKMCFECPSVYRMTALQLATLVNTTTGLMFSTPAVLGSSVNPHRCFSVSRHIRERRSCS